MARCVEVKVNRRVDDFSCSHEQGHPGPHAAKHGLKWGHPEVPYGNVKLRKSNGARGSTKPGHYWSKDPVK